eukprot:COSAG03_NODE_18114_length_361_cov_1.377863_1_plen_53_part_01
MLWHTYSLSGRGLRLERQNNFVVPCRESRVETGPRSMAIRSSLLAYLSDILFD